VRGHEATQTKRQPRARSTPNPESRCQPVVVIKLEHMRDRPPRFAHLWKTADVGSVFRFSGALDGFGNPLASAQYWCRKYRPDLEVSHSVSANGVLQVRFIKAGHDDEPVVRRYDGDGLTGR
jgi:hypothetical protein